MMEFPLRDRQDHGDQDIPAGGRGRAAEGRHGTSEGSGDAGPLAAAWADLLDAVQRERASGWGNRRVDGPFDRFARAAIARIAHHWPPEQREPLRQAYRLLADYGSQRAPERERRLDRMLALVGEMVHRSGTPLGGPGPASGETGTTANRPPGGAAQGAPLRPADPLRQVPGVGRRQAQRLARLGLVTVEDLLWHVPRRYEDRSLEKPVARLVPGETATVQATVLAVQQVPTRSGRSLVRVVVGDHSGQLQVVFFNQPFRLRQLRPGQQVLLSGKVDLFGRILQMEHPELELLDRPDSQPLHTARVVPVYPMTEGIRPRWFRELVWRVLEKVTPHLPEVLPEGIRHRYRLMDRPTAFCHLHFPPGPGPWREARRRLVFEEWFVMQTALARIRGQQRQQPGRAHGPDGPLVARFLSSLPFSLTPAQRQVVDEIRADMEAARPMRRLVQGDVGAGKTVVAAWAMVKAAEGGSQAALMAPTEILAEQHARRLRELLKPIGLPVVLLTGGQPAAEREDALAGLAAGRYPVVVGTHALIQEGVRFADLGLVVIDEQHRFGVRQRALLQSKGRRPDLLVMTATPIPRSLALTLYGDLDLSVIDQLPPGRKPVRTLWWRQRQRRRAYDLLAARVAAGEQGYVICPLVDEPGQADGDGQPAGTASGPAREEAGWRPRSAGPPTSAASSEPWSREGVATDHRALAVTSWARWLARRYPRMRLGILHGRMSSWEKERIMEAFEQGRLDVLVSTTVIEVGVDVANATMIIIEGADRFGLAQLHQLRGRVGRSHREALCILLADPKTDEGRRRLEALCRTASGFEIAEYDLQLRGPGDFFGTRQHGLPPLRIADPVRDAALLQEAREAARQLLATDPDLRLPEHQALRREVLNRYGTVLQQAGVLWS